MDLLTATHSIGCEVTGDCLTGLQRAHCGPYHLVRISSAGLAIIESRDGWHHEVYLGKIELANIQRPQLVERDFDA